MELGSYEISRTDANDICWNHMRSVVISRPTATLDRLLSIANSLYSGTKAMQVTAEITEAVRVIKAREDAEAAKVLNADEAGRIAAAAAGPASLEVVRIRTARATRIMTELFCYADSLVIGEGDEAAHGAVLVQASDRFRAIVAAEPHRVAKLLSSVEAGRVLDTLNALLAYRTPDELAASDWTGGTLDGTVDEGCYGDLEADKDERSADAEHYCY